MMKNILLVQKTVFGDVSYQEITEKGKEYMLTNEGKDDPYWKEEDLIRNYEELDSILNKEI